MDDKELNLQAEETLAITNPEAYAISNPTPRDWTMTAQEIARSIKINPIEALTTKAQREGPEKYNWLETVGKGIADAMVSGIQDIDEAINVRNMEFSSPDMTPDEAERLMQDALYTRHFLRQTRQADTAEKIKYKKWYDFSNAVGSAIKYAGLGLVTGSPMAIGAVAGIEAGAQMEADLVDRYIEKTGDIEGYTKDERLKDLGIAGAYGVFNGITETMLGVERLATGALGRYSTLEAMARLARSQGKIGKSIALKALRRAGMSAIEEGGEEFIQSIGEDLANAIAGYGEDLGSMEGFKKALTSAIYGAIIGGTMGWGLYRYNRKSIVDKINKWNTKNGAGLDEGQMAEVADQIIEDGKTQMLDEIATRVEIKNQYGQAYDKIKQRIKETIEATGTTPWTDPNKTLDEFVEENAKMLTVPTIYAENVWGIPMSEFIDVAKLTNIPGTPFLTFEPITNIDDAKALLEEQKQIVKEQTDAKKLGVEKEGLKEAAQRRIAMLNIIIRNMEREQGLQTARRTRKKAQADYITAKDLKPESTGTIETATQAEEGQEYVMFAGQRIPVEYQVVELADIQPSHIDGEPNPNYTNTELQNRASRGTVQDVADLREKATNITPERLLRAPTSAEGAPVVNELGEVIAGNGRAEIIRYAYQNPESAEKYRQALTKAGFDTTGMTQPVLVRRNTTMTPQEQVAAAELSNISETSAFDEASQAKRDSQYLKDSENPTDFAGKIPMSERRGLMQNNGKWNSRQVKQRYEDALLSWLAGNDTQLFESLVLDGKIPQKVLDVLTTNGALIHAVATKYPDTNLREDIYHALQKMQIASKDNFVELTQQIELDGRDVMPENILVWNWLFADTTTNRQFLNNYATILRQNRESMDNGQDMFGDKVAPLSKKDALMQALKKTDEARAQVAAERGREYEGLFAQDTGEVTNAELAAAIASYKNQFAPVAQAQLANVQQIIEQVLTMDPVSELTGKEFQKDETKLTEKVNKYYQENYNNQIERAGVGIVKLDLRSIKDSMAHGVSKEKSAAFQAVPEVIKNGLIFDEQSNYKDRGYDTVSFIAPITIGNIRYACEVIVRQNADRTGFYLHNVELETILADVLKTRPDTEFSTGTSANSRLNIIDKLKKVKTTSPIKLAENGGVLNAIRRGTLQGQYDPELQTILLTKHWDETTLVHEFHHRYLEKIWGKFKQAQAGTFQANAAFIEDTKKLMEMLDIDPNQDELTVVQQEKFATMVEAYVTGLGVDDQENLAFQGFLHWVPEKYRSIMDLGYLDEQGKIQNPMLDQASIDFFNRWFASPLVPSLPSAPDAQRMVNVSDDKNEIIPSSQKVMNDREKEWGQDSEIQNKADAQLWKAIGENNPSDLRAGIDGQEEINKEELKNTEDDRILPEKPTLREKWFKARQPNARELAAEKAREYVAKNPEHARELAFADPETLADFDAPVDQGMLIRAVMETVAKGSDEWYILDNNLAMVKSMSGSTLALSGDLSHQAYLDAKREVEAARELKAAVNYAGTRFGAMDKWNSDIRAFAAKRTAAILATAPNSKEREVAIKAFLEEAKTKFSGNTTNAVLNKLDLTGYQTTSNQAFIKWAEKQIRNVAHAQLDAKEQAELMKASVKAQLALRDIDSRELKDDKYVRAVTAAKDIRHWQFVKDKMKKAYIGRWGRFGIFMDNLFGSYAPSAMLMSVNTLFFANVPSTALNNAIVSRAARLIGENKVDSKATKGEIQRIKQIFNASGMNLAQMEKPTSPSLMHGEKYTNQEQTHWYNFTFDILGKEDNWFRIPTFVDALARIATRDAKGDTNKATMLFKQYAQLNDQTDEAKIARKEALAVANMAVFTQDGTLASALNHIRSNLNTLSRGLLGLDPNGFGLGNILAPFLKTGANVIEMGITATLAPVRTAAKGLKVLRGKELTDLEKISLTTDWIYLALAAVSTAVLAAISGDDDDWYQEPYQPGRKYDPNKPYDSIRLGNTWIKLDIFGPLEVPLRTAAMLVKNWEDKKLAAVGNGLYEALGEVPLVNQVTDSSADYMAKYPGKWASSFAYNQLNKLMPAQVKTITRAGSRAAGTTADVSALGPTIEKKFHRNYGLDGERLTTNDLIGILTNRIKVVDKK